MMSLQHNQDYVVIYMDLLFLVSPDFYEMLYEHANNKVNKEM